MVKLLIPLFLISVVLYGYITQRFANRPKSRRVAANRKPQLAQLPLAEAVRHPDWKQRLAAVEQLKEQKALASIELLLPMLDDADSEVREKAKHALVEMGQLALPDLLEVLRRGRLNARQGAAEALGMIRDARAVEALGAALIGDESMWVRVAAANALGEIGGVQVEDALNAGMDDDNPDVRDASATALERAVFSEDRP